MPRTPHDICIRGKICRSSVEVECDRRFHPRFDLEIARPYVSNRMIVNMSSTPVSSLSSVTVTEPERDVESQRSRHLSSHFRTLLDQGGVTPEVLNWRYKGNGTDDEPFIVDFLEGDPKNPMTFPQSKKWTITILQAFAVLAVAFVSTAFSGGISEVIEEFQVKQIIAILGISLFVTGFAVGSVAFTTLRFRDVLTDMMRKSSTVGPSFRALRPTSTILWNLCRVDSLQRRCCSIAKYPNPHCPSVLRWYLWFVANDECWRSHRRYVLSIGARNGYCCVRHGTVFRPVSTFRNRLYSPFKHLPKLPNSPFRDLQVLRH